MHVPLPERHPSLAALVTPHAAHIRFGIIECCMSFVLGVDCGTASVRAAVVKLDGTIVGVHTHPIQIFKPKTDHMEQSSDDIWNATCEAVKGAIAVSGVDPTTISGVGFDATCSLVVLDASGAPISVSTTGESAQNIIMWCDHRAIQEAHDINKDPSATNVLKYLGGIISPENEIPKLLWLQRHSSLWPEMAHCMDLPDFLTFRASGSYSRSLCSTVCKWTHLAHEGGWQNDFLSAIGLGACVENNNQRIGSDVRPVGQIAGYLSEEVAKSWGVPAGMPVAVSAVDAHAGAIGVLGVSADGQEHGSITEKMAIIAGTSSCHMSVTEKDAPYFTPGVWGPFLEGVLPGMWLIEGGQSATGSLLDHVCTMHPYYVKALAQAEGSHGRLTTILNARLQAIGPSPSQWEACTRYLHVLPYFHGNRSPRADPLLKGVISGLSLDDSIDSLAALYLSTVQAICYGTLHIIKAIEESGRPPFRYLVLTGGLAKNPVFVQEMSDITACTILLPVEDEAVMLGSAMLGAVASGAYTTVPESMQAMSKCGDHIKPRECHSRFHQAKYQVFLTMYEQWRTLQQLMAEA
jgi:FGGY-family pentulose kinase